MDFRREDEEKKMNHQEDVHQENEKQIDEPEKEKELVYQPHENEASATQESVTNHSPQMEDDRASKRRKSGKRHGSVRSLEGLLAEALCLALHRFCRSHRTQLQTHKRKQLQVSRQLLIISQQNKSPMPRMSLIW